MPRIFLHEIIEKLEVSNKELVQLRKIKRSKDYLKLILIGFFAYRDITGKIVVTESKRTSLIKDAEIAHVNS